MPVSFFALHLVLGSHNFETHFMNSRPKWWSEPQFVWFDREISLILWIDKKLWIDFSYLKMFRWKKVVILAHLQIVVSCDILEPSLLLVACDPWETDSFIRDDQLRILGRKWNCSSKWCSNTSQICKTKDFTDCLPIYWKDWFIINRLVGLLFPVF